MKRISFFVLGSIFLSLFLILSTNSEEDAERYGKSIYKLILKKENLPEYAALAKTIGFHLLSDYTYAEYDEIKRENEVGTPGNYEFLKLSTGGNEWDGDAWQKYIQQDCGWETIYYSNHDLTVIHEECRSADRSTTTVRILKVAKGRRPDLYKE